MKKNLYCFLIITFLISILTTSHLMSQINVTKDALLNKISEMKDQTHVRTVIGGVWEGDKEILTVALGESMTNVPATLDMHFRTGGVTETFMGTLTMMLVEQGKLNLNDKASKWLPSLLAADSVTVRMLIKNTSGYKDYVLNKDFLNLITQHPFRFISRDEIISFATSDDQLNFPPGTDQHYSHTNFTILGEIMERATGKTLAELYEENIFKPLGLTNTGFNVRTAELPSPVVHAFSSDRGIYEDATYWSPSWTADSGPIYSNLQDLSKWARVFGTGKLLTKKSFDELTSRPANVTSNTLYMASGFGVSNGWYFQNPSFNGYSGGFSYYPSKEITVIIFTTESEDPKSGSKAIEFVQELVKMITPEALIHFK